jgi:HEAT repeat protein
VGNPYDAVRDVFRTIPPQDWTPELQRDVLYALARDNEDQVLLGELVNHPEALLRLSDAAIACPDREARWQVAHALGQVNDSPAESETLLRHFVIADEEEYVRRRALLALGNRRSPSAEPLALAVWDTAEEYPRIAAMEVLYQVQSSHLPRILEAAHGDTRETVRTRAVWIRQQLTSEE